MARQASLFAPPARETRQPLAPPHATAEDLARKRDVFMLLVPPHAAQLGSVLRCDSRPVEALDAFLPRIGRRAGALQAVQGATPQDIELRLTQAAAGQGPLHMLALIEGLTLDEARKGLAALKARGL
jgi:hypothetical protein